MGIKAITTQKIIYDKWKYKYIKLKNKKMKEITAQFKNKKVLDIGSGNGIINEILPQIKYTGIDFSKIAVKDGIRKGYNIIRHDITKTFPFKNNTFHLIIASEIIEHILDTDYILRECYRVLKKNGTLILTTPNICSFSSRMRVLFGKRPLAIDYRVNLTTAGHIRGFSSHEIKILLNENKFNIIKFSGCEFNLPLISSETKYFGIIPEILSNIFPKFSEDFIITAKKI